MEKKDILNKKNEKEERKKDKLAVKLLDSIDNKSNRSTHGKKDTLMEDTENEWNESCSWT